MKAKKPTSAQIAAFKVAAEELFEGMQADRATMLKDREATLEDRVQLQARLDHISNQLDALRVHCRLRLRELKEGKSIVRMRQLLPWRLRAACMVLLRTNTQNCGCFVTPSCSQRL